MERLAFNDDWGYVDSFTEEFISKDGRKKPDKVRIPHTVATTPFNYFSPDLYQKVSGYVKIYNAPKSLKGKRVFLNFAGVAHSAFVYVNGVLVGEHHNGYTAFDVELTNALNYGEDNRIVVKVDSRESLNIPPFGYVIDYMTYGGIYREVTLLIKDEMYIKDVYAKPVVPDGLALPGEFKNNKSMGMKLNSFTFDATLALSITLDGLDEAARNSASYIVKLVDAKTDEVIFNSRIESGNDESDTLDDVTIFRVPAGFDENTSVYDIFVNVSNVKLWDTVIPNRYKLTIELMKGDKAIDDFNQTIGFRRIEFRNDGFFLNGRRVKLRGLNRHQSYPYVGYAMPESMQKLDADILRLELGVNAVRTSHYPQSKHFIERCNELGLLVFTEIPGWQHIGDAEWKDQAVENVKEMVVQYRNEPSIILWGVRINESQDDDEFYLRTNEACHELDDTRPTGGVRYLEKSSLLEDVYTFNDFSHDGTSSNAVKKKSSVTSDVNKPYLISEYNGHMYPTKPYDDEEHRLAHALRHADVINSVNKEKDILGAFGWCMFDYNTHKDFGSGDMICYHGVMDMFRNPKLASYVYASQQNRTPVLEVSSSMDIGDHPAGCRGGVYIFTNADSVRMYKNDVFIKEFTRADSPYKYMKHPPLLIDDYVGDQLETIEGFEPKKAALVKKALNYIGQYGMNHLPVNIQADMARAMAFYHMTFADAYDLYQRYVGNWGGESNSFRFEAIKDGEIVKEVTKSTMTELHIEAVIDHEELKEGDTYDIAAIRVRVLDDNGNVATYFNQPLSIKVKGACELIGPKLMNIAGGMGGAYIKTIGEPGEATIKIAMPEGYADSVKLRVNVSE